MAKIYAQPPVFHWVKKLHSFVQNANLGLYKIVLDDSDNIYALGTFESTKDFDPGPGVYNMTSIGLPDMYIQKLDHEGNFIWAKCFDSRDGQNPTDIVLDKKGRIYITGSFTGPMDFDPGIGVYNLTSYGSDAIFVSKLDNNGNFIWAKSMGGVGHDRGMSIVVDTTGYVYTTGYFSHKDSDFEPGAGTYYLPFSGPRNAFISKLDSNGNFVFAKSFIGSPGDNSSSYSLKKDKSNNIYISGGFGGKIDFDPGAGLALPDSTEGTFMVKLNSSGSFIWFKEFHGISTTFSGFQIDNSENLILSGTLHSPTFDADPGPGTFLMSKPADKDWSLIVKLNKNGNFVWARNLEGTSGSSSFIYGGNTDFNNNIYLTGYFRDTIDVDPGTPYFPLITASNSGTYLLRLDSNGTFNWVTQFDDSILNAHPTISKRGNIYCRGSFRKKADFDPGMDTFFLSADSVLLTSYILKISRCQTKTNLTKSVCNKFDFAGKIYTSSGKYSPLLKGVSGCDSIINLDLTVNHINDTIDKTAYTLSSKAAGALYQWVKCPSFLPVTGATFKTFTPTAGGSYAVIVTQYGCSDTSDCATVFGTIIENIKEDKDCLISPNPASGAFNIQINEQWIGAMATIYNVYGQKVIGMELDKINNSCSLNSGSYFIEITTGEKRTVRKIIIN